MKLLLAIVLSLVGTTAHASHRLAHKQVIVQKQLFVVSPYAVPVGVPVASYGGYSYQQTAKAPAPPPRTAEEVFADKVLAIIEAKQSGHVNALGAPTMFGMKCASCHSKTHEDGRPVFGPLDTLSERQRLAAIREMKAGRMPKGGKLSEEDASKLVDELLSEPDAPPPVDEREVFNQDGSVKSGWRSVPVDEAVRNGVQPPPRVYGGEPPNDPELDRRVLDAIENRPPPPNNDPPPEPMP